MGAKTNISWCDATWNPLRGCSRVSAGCQNCYAEQVSGRFGGPGMPYEGLTRPTTHGPVWTGEVRLIEEALELPLKWKKPRRVFVNSMSDLFHESVPDAWIDRIFDVMLEAPHTFQVLTKRPERMQAYVTRFLSPALLPRILENIWLGVSVENQAMADERIPLLLQTPAMVRFVSYEPALEAVDFTSIKWTGPGRIDSLTGRFQAIEGLSWVICGGESGPKARPFRLDWAEAVVQQCRRAEVPLWMKQVGSMAYDYHGYLRGFNEVGVCAGCTQCRWKTKHKAGADPTEWPASLRVQQFPVDAVATI